MSSVVQPQAVNHGRAPRWFEDQCLRTLHQDRERELGRPLEKQERRELSRLVRPSREFRAWVEEFYAAVNP